MLLTLVAAVLVLLAPAGATAAPSEPDPPATTVPAAAPAGPPVTVLENDFIPEDRDLSECISALPEPGCGSKARGGWRQTIVFLVIVAGLAFIAWRIVRSARRNRRRELDEVTHDA